MNAADMLAEYEAHLRREERSANTVGKYIRDLRACLGYLGGRPLTKEALVEWKGHLAAAYAPSSVNSMLAAVNSFLEWSGLPQYRIKPLKLQRAIFAKPEKELTAEEYRRLVEEAERRKDRRLSLLLQTVCATGIRISELRFVTAAALKAGRVTVDCKGKARVVFLPALLCRALCAYCREMGIESGVIFRTKGGKPVDRSNVWKEMKALCARAQVAPGKVFPHNLRHLFARTYYTLEKDLARLADLLGHSSVSTTRIYTMESGREHLRQLERMGLVLVGRETRPPRRQGPAGQWKSCAPSFTTPPAVPG